MAEGGGGGSSPFCVLDMYSAIQLWEAGALLSQPACLLVPVSLLLLSTHPLSLSPYSPLYISYLLTLSLSLPFPVFW